MTTRQSTALKVAAFLAATLAATGALVAAGLAERASAAEPVPAHAATPSIIGRS